MAADPRRYAAPGTRAGGRRGTAVRPRVAVLMAVFRDARFLPMQLSSLRAQAGVDLDLWISRDCDEAEVGRVLKEHRKAFETGHFHLRAGPRRGAAANFLSLVFDEAIQADYFAYADQDDVWEPDKLARAVAALERFPAAVPALYGSRSRLIGADGSPLGLSWFDRQAPCFRRALGAQNIISGHSAVFNRAARDLLRASGVREVPVHDWWTYLLVAGAGGHVLYDPYPGVRYRLHDRNLMHRRTTGGVAGRAFRALRRLADGESSRKIAASLRALRRAEGLLTPENRIVLDIYEEALGSSLFLRPWRLWRAGVYRLPRLRSVLMFVEAVLNKP